MTPTLGVDPGGRYTGLAVVAGDELLEATVVDRRRLIGPAELDGWARHVMHLAVDLAAAHDVGLVAVEGVRAPNPHVRRRDGNAVTNPTGIIDTAAVYGALVARFPQAVTVSPGGNGDGPDATYPAAIRKGTRGLGGPPAHARSAYDVARAGRFLARIRTHR